jgi:hypothetical protein
MEKPISKDKISEWLRVCSDLRIRLECASYSGYTSDVEQLAKAKGFQES